MKAPRYERLTSDAEIVDAGSKTYSGKASDESVGRDDHVVITAGIDATNWLATGGVMPFAHDDTEPPVANAFRAYASDGDFRIAWRFVDRDVLPFAGTIQDLVDRGSIRSLSMSWKPLEWRRANDRSRATEALDFLACDLIEVSVVPCPALPSALIDRSRGIDLRPLRRWAESAIARGGVGSIGCRQLERIARAAGPARSVSLSTREIQADSPANLAARARAIRQRVARDDLRAFREAAEERRVRRELVLRGLAY